MRAMLPDATAETRDGRDRAMVELMITLPRAMETLGLQQAFGLIDMLPDDALER